MSIPNTAEAEATTALLPDSLVQSYDSIVSRPHPSQEVQRARQLDNDVLTETATVGRNLSWSSAYILVISRVIGSGIFAMPGSVLRSAGSIGLSLLLWIVGALLAWCGLVTSMEYGCMLPRSGGDKVYLEFTYRKPRFLASTVVAVYAVLLGLTATNCIVFSEYAFFAAGIRPTDVQQKAVALGLLVAITVVHGCFLRTGILIQNVLGWAKVGLVIFMFLTGMFVVATGGLHGRTDAASSNSELWAQLWEGSNWGWGIISTAIFKVSYTFSGLNNANNVLNEVKDPVRTLRSVGPFALLTACLLYLLINIAYFLVVPVQEIKDSGELIAALFCQRVFGHGFGRVFLPLAIALSAAANVMVVTFAYARINQEIARQGFLPFSHLLSSSQPFGTPLGGLIVHLVPSALVILIPPSADAYAFIADVEGYAGQFFVIAVSLGLIWLRRQKPDLKRPFRAWLPAVWLRAVLSVGLVVAPFFPPADGAGADVGFFYATYALVGIAVLSFGFLYWYVWTVALPRWRGTRLVEREDVLDDGTTITRLVEVKID